LLALYCRSTSLVPLAEMSRAQRPLETLPQNQTLYVNNLNDKINVETLKKSLKEVFAAFGGIVEIIAMKSLKRRGQAWIIFKEHSSATNALKSLQGFPFYNKPMRINYARTKSDAVAKTEGTFVERPKKIVKREDLRKGKTAAPAVSAAPAPAPAAVAPVAAPAPVSAAASAAQQKNIQDRIGWNPQQSTTTPKPAAAVPQVKANDPNKTLFVENLPNEATDTMLSMLFRQYPGFHEVRLIPGRAVAFVDYMNEYQAGMAMQGLQGFAMTPEVKLCLSYAKK
jgi:U1 small nuclear ribonucleoprotein A